MSSLSRELSVELPLSAARNTSISQAWKDLFEHFEERKVRESFDILIFLLFINFNFLLFRMQNGKMSLRSMLQKPFDVNLYYYLRKVDMTLKL